MSAPVFLAETARLEQYPAGSVYVLDGPEGRHAGVVQRRRAGEQRQGGVVDGGGGEEGGGGLARHRLVHETRHEREYADGDLTEKVVVQSI